MSQNEFYRKRGYDVYGRPVKYELREYSCSGEIFNNLSTRTIFLQGDDFETVSKIIATIWKRYRWKKIGLAHAWRLQNETLEQYYGDE